MVFWYPLLDLIGKLLILLLFLLNLLIDVLVTGECHVYNLNQLMVPSYTQSSHLVSVQLFPFLSDFQRPSTALSCHFYNCFCSHFSLCQYWLFSSNPFSTAYIVIRTFNSLLCFFRYSLPASIWHLDAWCVTPSTHFLQSRHLSESMCMPLFLF